MKELSDCRILIVDDAEANVDVLVSALRDEYKLSVAIDGEGALRSIEKSPPDLVLLDIVMPGIDGYEVCRRLRAAAATRELPIMFLSSLEDVKDKTRGFEVGANDYVTKPFEVAGGQGPRPVAAQGQGLRGRGEGGGWSGTCASPARSRWGSCPRTLLAGARDRARRPRAARAGAAGGGTSTRCCGSPTAGSWWRWATSRARASRPRSSWASP